MVNLQKPIIFLYISTEHLDIEINVKAFIIYNSIKIKT